MPLEKVAIVTGCSSGFGLLIVIELAKSGYHVVATMRDLTRNHRLLQVATPPRVLRTPFRFRVAHLLAGASAKTAPNGSQGGEVSGRTGGAVFRMVDVPGADDSAIQADILATLGRDASLVREALDQLTRLAGAPFAGLDPARREAVAMELRAKGGAAVATLTRVVLQCYYRDDRVVRSLGLEPRPPSHVGTC